MIVFALAIVCIIIFAKEYYQKQYSVSKLQLQIPSKIPHLPTHPKSPKQHLHQVKQINPNHSLVYQLSNTPLQII